MTEEEQIKKDLKSMSYSHVNHEALTNRLISIQLEKLQKHHWSVTPLFWVSVVGAVAAVVAAYYAYLAYSQPQQPSVVSPQSQSVPSTLPKQLSQLQPQSTQQNKGKL